MRNKHKSFKSFGNSLDRYKRSIPKAANEVKKKAARELVEKLIPATPVLTGQARSNWTVTANTPFTRMTLFPAVDTSGGPSRASLERTISTVQPQSDIYIRNNLPYIVRLNQGYSKQAPANFVQGVIGEVKGKFSGMIKFEFKQIQRGVI